MFRQHLIDEFKDALCDLPKKPYSYVASCYSADGNNCYEVDFRTKGNDDYELLFKHINDDYEDFYEDYFVRADACDIPMEFCNLLLSVIGYLKSKVNDDDLKEQFLSALACLPGLDCSAFDNIDFALDGVHLKVFYSELSDTYCYKFNNICGDFDEAVAKFGVSVVDKLINRFVGLVNRL